MGGHVSKTIFPSGIIHFTLFNDDTQPINERMIFVDQQDNLHIELGTDKTSYVSRDSIALHVKVMDKQQQPITGSFSLAVTDDAQVKTDSFNTENILTRMFLSTELKGTIEDPAWYFSRPGDAVVAKALDALLLTQGWTGYNWQNIFNKKPVLPLFAAQPGFMVTGKVTNLFNKPLENAGVLMMSTGKNGVFRDTVTDKEGRFVFYNFPVADSPSYIVQARNAKGKNFGIGLTLDEFTPPEIKPEGTGPLLPWNVNGDSALLSYVKNNYQHQQDELTGGGQYRVLRRVIVNGRKGVPGSLNLNGPGGADQVVDQAEIEKAGKLNLKQLMEKTVKGFRVLYGAGGTETYKINSNDLRIVIDGVPLARFGSQRETLEYIQASDVKGIEVMNSMRNTSAYRTTFLSINQQMNMNREFSFVEITTFSGNGIFMKKVPGVYVYKPMPLSWPAKFYSPRYTVKDAASKTADLRSTIYWQPNLVTDTRGLAETSFYAADKPTTYTVVLQGSDMGGNIGFRTVKIVVGK